MDRYTVIIEFDRHGASYLNIEHFSFCKKQDVYAFCKWAIDHTVYSAELIDNASGNHVSWIKEPS